jgi:alpha-beta hydrolase superfamily lysophospholipase
MAKYPDLPTFLYGNSMGCMVLTTYLQRNPDLHLAGVIFSAPFFYIPDTMEQRDFKMLIAPYAGAVLKDFLLGSHIKKGFVTLNDTYMSRFMNYTSMKGYPFMEPSGVANFSEAFNCIITRAHQFYYPFLLMQGRKDRVVCNDRPQQFFK